MGLSNESTECLRCIKDYTHRTEHVIRSVGVWLLTYNQHATYQTMELCPLSILWQVPRSMSHILVRKKEYLGSADMYSFRFVGPLEDTCSTLYLLPF